VQADFTTFAVLLAIRSEAPRLHGLRLAYATNSTREKSELGKQDNVYEFAFQYYIDNEGTDWYCNF